MKAFYPSPKFSGRKDGYVFRNGDWGVGYYVDPTQKHSEVSELRSITSYRIDSNILLNSKVQAGDKRKHDDLGSSTDARDEMPSKHAHYGRAGSAIPDTEDIEDTNAETEDQGITELDDITLKQLLVSLEKKIANNQKLRVKFADEPEKFMESEFELHQEIQTLHLIAAYPSLYPILLQSGTLGSILGLISHENTDISIAVVSLLQEIVDLDEDVEGKEELEAFAQAFIEGQGIELVIQNLFRLDEANSDEDAQAVHQTFSILENLIEIDATCAKIIVQRTKILQYLMERLQRKEWDSNKLYASEILAILIQSAPAPVLDQIVREESLLDNLLQAIAAYRKKELKLAEEIECVENLFLSLSSLLLYHAIHPIFLKFEGFELLVRCLQAQEYAAIAALSSLHSALVEDREACEHFIEIGGLKFIFSYLSLITSSSPQHKLRKVILLKQRSLEESMLCIIAQLSLQLGRDLGVSGKRLANKLLTDSHSQLRALCELFYKHDKHLSRFDKERRASSDEDEELLLLDRLENGLFAMQQISIIIGFVCRVDLLSARVVASTLEKLSASDASRHDDELGFADVLAVLRGFIMSLSDPSDLNEEPDGTGDVLKREENQSRERKRRDMETCIQWAALMGTQVAPDQQTTE